MASSSSSSAQIDLYALDLRVKRARPFWTEISEDEILSLIGELRAARSVVLIAMDMVNGDCRTYLMRMNAALADYDRVTMVKESRKVYEKHTLGETPTTESQ